MIQKYFNDKKYNDATELLETVISKKENHVNIYRYAITANIHAKKYQGLWSCMKFF